MTIHAFSGIRTHEPSNQAAADLRLKPHGHLDRLQTSHTLTEFVVTHRSPSRNAGAVPHAQELVTVTENHISEFANELVRDQLLYGCRVTYDPAYTPCSSVQRVTAAQPKTLILIFVLSALVSWFKLQSNADKAPVLFHRSLSRYIERGCKSKYCITRNFCSQTVEGTKWGWRYSAARGGGQYIAVWFYFHSVVS
jgi:hypothetical protein